MVGLCLVLFPSLLLFTKSSLLCLFFRHPVLTMTFSASILPESSAKKTLAPPLWFILAQCAVMEKGQNGPIKQVISCMFGKTCGTHAVHPGVLGVEAKVSHAFLKGFTQSIWLLGKSNEHWQYWLRCIKPHRGPSRLLQRWFITPQQTTRHSYSWSFDNY